MIDPHEVPTEQLLQDEEQPQITLNVTVPGAALVGYIVGAALLLFSLLVIGFAVLVAIG